MFAIVFNVFCSVAAVSIVRKDSGASEQNQLNGPLESNKRGDWRGEEERSGRYARDQKGVHADQILPDANHKCLSNVVMVPVPVFQGSSKDRLKHFKKHVQEIAAGKSVSIDRDRGQSKGETPMEDRVANLMTIYRGQGIEGPPTAFEKFFSSPKGQEPLVTALLEAVFHGKNLKDVEKLKWEKDGHLHVDFHTPDPYGWEMAPLSLWVLLPKWFIRQEFFGKHGLTYEGLKCDSSWGFLGNNDCGVKMRFTLNSIDADGTALFEFVSQSTARTRIKEVFQSNHFADCDKVMEEEMTAISEVVIPSEEDVLVKRNQDDMLRKEIAAALAIARSDAYKGRTFTYEGKWKTQKYTHHGESLARWYFRAVWLCQYTNGRMGKVCKQYNNNNFGGHNLIAPAEGSIY